MLEQFEQPLKQLDEAGITPIEVLQSVIEEIQAIGNDSDSSISSNEESSSESDSSESSEGSESSGNDSEVDDSEEDLELEVRLVMVHWMLTHRYLHERQNLPQSESFI